ncbi:MAG TPA: glucose-1-phosphate adenylyltransferase subunit GlgD, partial [Candidatus Olsenella stercoravium]|nr:glucose-1-phosphate adenylyltransferase subunit GlgD [Candidatus Olsenella stercoravium]
MEKVIGLITCNYSAKESSALTESRPVASLPYFGRYRLVDFAMSNLVNCGIRTVGMVMPYNYRSIIDHVGSGKDWDL